ncbi:MAG: winged helix-turn-helix transcriptional regulator [Clostridia bacterium]|nr:winged helix-turn-helix transcriptional regulator [Clostridia bacterium]
MEQNRDYGAEIDALREEIAELKALITGVKTEEKPAGSSGGERVGHVKKMVNMHPDGHIMSLMSECEDKCGSENLTGCVTYLGVFASGGNQSSWAHKSKSTDELLEIGLTGRTEKMLACIGSQERLNILITLLRQPMSAASLMETLQFTSPGRVYHHLKPLIAADLVREDERVKGRYEIVPHRVQGLVMILAGVADLLDTEFSSGTLEES